MGRSFVTIAALKTSSRELTARGCLLRRVAVIFVVFAASSASAEPGAWAVSSYQPHPAVVRVVAPERDGMSLGSGSLVAVNEHFGLVLTNWHVVRDAAGQVGVLFPDGFRSAATVARVDRDWDLAALVIWRPKVQPISLSSQAPRPGEMLTIAGYGSGSYRAASGRCTEYVSPGENMPYEMVELEAPARQGDSGGPILNSRGELAGVLFGSAFGRTTGSYCGRVRWFLAFVDADFRKLSSQTMIAQQPRQEAAPLAAIPAPQQPATAAQAAAQPNPPTAPSAPPASAMAAAPATHAVPAPSACSLPTPPPAATRSASLPQPTTLFPSADRIKSVLAAIGALAVLYTALRLLGRAVG